ncbi:MAG: hemagglutinin [Gammaproteobacteria bacterium]|nr:hemagglutinin [Gammaproteobacteria bacterium]
MKNQFVTTVVAILMVGVTTIGVNLSVISAMGEANDARFAQIDARFEQVDARFERMDRRLDQMEDRIESLERRVDDGFREMAAAIARLEGLIHGLHGTARTTTGHPASEPEQSS